MSNLADRIAWVYAKQPQVHEIASVAQVFAPSMMRETETRFAVGTIVAAHRGAQSR